MTKLFYSASYDLTTPSGIYFTLLRVRRRERGGKYFRGPIWKVIFALLPQAL